MTMVHNYAEVAFSRLKCLESKKKLIEQLGLFLSCCSSNKFAIEILFNRHVDISLKEDFVQEFVQAVQGFFTEDFVAFLKLLIKRKNLILLPNILQYMKNMILEEQNILQADVITPYQLNNDAQQKIVNMLKEKSCLVGAAQINFIIDSTILGGLIIKWNNKILDLSIKNRLAQLKMFLIQ